VANNPKYTLALPEQFTLRGLIDVSPLLAETMVKVAELEHARPAEEATLQEKERTRQSATIARHRTFRAALVPLLAAGAIVAACAYGSAKDVVWIVGLIVAHSIMKLWKAKDD
jgi:hypothetical protein